MTSAPAPLLLDEHLYDPEPDEPRDRPAWLVPALLAGLVVVLLLGAYGIGRVLSDNLSDTDVTPEEPDGVVLSEDGSTSTPESPTPKPSKKPQAKKYAGRDGLGSDRRGVGRPARRRRASTRRATR